MALVDVYECRVTGLILGSPWALVAHVLRAGAGFGATDVLNAFGGDPITEIKDSCTDKVSFTDLTVKSLGNPLDFAQYSFGVYVGTHNADEIGPRVARSIRFTRKRTDMHHGYKRLPGASEADVALGVIQAGQAALMAAVGAAFTDNWEDPAVPAVTVCNFIIVKRVLDGGVYRLPQTDGELQYYQPSNYVVQTNLSTQNSRKFE